MPRSARFALLAVLLAAPACGRAPAATDALPDVVAAAALPAEGASIIGTITQFREGGGRASLLVEQEPTRSAGYPVAWVYTLPETRVLRRTGDGTVVRARASELAVGTRVQAWFTGPVRESYPVQADAAAILIVP